MSVTISELKSGLATALSAELDNETPLVVATYTRERGWVVFHSGDPADPLAVPTGECEIAPEPNLDGIEWDEILVRVSSTLVCAKTSATGACRKRTLTTIGGQTCVLVSPGDAPCGAGETCRRYTACLV